MQKHYQDNCWGVSFVPSRLVWASASEALGRMTVGEKVEKKPKKTPERTKESAQKEREVKEEKIEKSAKKSREMLRKELVKDRLFKHSKQLQDYIVEGKKEIEKSGAATNLKLKFFEALGYAVNIDHVSRMSQFIYYSQLLVYEVLGGKEIDFKGQPSEDITPEFLDALDKFLTLDPNALYESDEAQELGDGEVQEGKEKEEQNEVFQNYLIANREGLIDLYRSALESQLGETSDYFDTEVFYENLDKVIEANEEQFDLSQASEWRKAFKKAGLSDDVIEALGLMPELGDKKESSESVDQDQIRKKAVKEAVDRFNDSVAGLSENFVNEENKVKIEIDRVEDLPFQSYPQIQRHRGLSQALDNYREIYKTWLSKRKNGEAFREVNEQKEAAYDRLERAFEKYYEMRQNLEKDLKREYALQLSKIADRYDFPPEVPLAELRIPSQVRSHPFYREIKIPYFLFRMGFDNQKLLRERPKRRLRFEEDLYKYAKGSEYYERRVNAQDVIKEVKKMGGGDPIEVINNWIYKQNILDFTDQHSRLIESYYQGRQKRISELQNLPLDAFMEEKV